MPYSATTCRWFSTSSGDSSAAGAPPSTRVTAIVRVTALAAPITASAATANQASVFIESPDSLHAIEHDHRPPLASVMVSVRPSADTA